MWSCVNRPTISRVPFHLNMSGMARPFDPVAGSLDRMGPRSRGWDGVTKRLAVYVGGLCAVVLLGCSEATDPAQRVHTLTVTPPTVVLNALGASVTLRAVAKNAEGQEVYGDSPGWASSDTSIATVNSAGSVVAVRNGSVTVSATLGTLDASASVTVEQAVAVIEVTPSGANRVPGETATFSAAAFDANGHPMPDSSEIRWSTSDPGIATADGTGAVLAHSDGLVDIEANLDTVVGVATLRVAPPFASLGGREAHVCGVTLDGRAYCWGSQGPQIGDGSFSIQHLIPSLVAGQHLWEAVSAGSHTCGVTRSGQTLCWGGNAHGELGVDSTTEQCFSIACSTIPIAIAGGLSLSQVSVAEGHTCGITSGGVAYCWGVNISGALGDGTSTNRSKPELVTGGLAFAAVSSGDTFTCGITTTGQAYCWGSNANWQLGDGTTVNNRLVPVPVVGGLTFQSLNAGTTHVCGVTVEGHGYCWGRNVERQLGSPGGPDFSATPLPVTGGRSLSQISAATFHSCAITTDGEAYCWGANWNGELGDSTTTSSAVPVRVAGGFRWASIHAGRMATCGASDIGVARCWGINPDGEVGDGTKGSRNYPLRVWGTPSP